MGRDQKRRGIAVASAWLPVPLEFLRSRACAGGCHLMRQLLLDVLASLGRNASRQR